MARTKSSLITQAIEQARGLIYTLEKIQSEYEELQADRQALKELEPLVKKVKQIYFPDEEPPSNEPPGNEPPGNEPPGNEPPGEETPGEETPGEETPGEKPKKSRKKDIINEPAENPE